MLELATTRAATPPIPATQNADDDFAAYHACVERLTAVMLDRSLRPLTRWAAMIALLKLRRLRPC